MLVENTSQCRLPPTTMDSQTQQQQQSPVSEKGDKEVMEVENKEASTTATTTTTSTGQEGPLTRTQKREKLVQMREHVKAAECEFFDMDRAFKDEYHTLEKEYEKDMQEHTDFMKRLCEESGLPMESRAAICEILNNTNPLGASLQQHMVDFVGANSDFYNRAITRSNQEKEDLIQQNAMLKKQLEQEAVNANNKRARPVSYTPPSPFAFKPSTPPPTTSVVPHQTTVTKSFSQKTVQHHEKKDNPVVSAAPQNLSFRDMGTVRGTTPILNPNLTKLVDAEHIGYSERHNYAANTPGQYAYWQQFNLMCNGGGAHSTKPTYT